MSSLRADYVLRQNIQTLLHSRKETQSDLAKWMQKDKTWINKFLLGKRGLQIKDLDRIADFFGLEAYELFRPGISSLTERRKKDRRQGQDRRISKDQRELLALAPRRLHNTVRRTIPPKP